MAGSSHKQAAGRQQAEEAATKQAEYNQAGRTACLTWELFGRAVHTIANRRDHRQSEEDRTVE